MDGEWFWQVLGTLDLLKQDIDSIEGEALAVVYSLETSKMFVTGCPKLIVSVDHKPLLKILSNEQPLDQI